MRLTGALVIALLLAACTQVSGPAVPGMPAPGMPAPGGAVPFPECDTAEYAFSGVSTLAALGMDEFAGGPDASRPGMIWVTANPVDQTGMFPPGEAPPPSRMVCVQWADGSGMSGPVPVGWEPPEGPGVTIAGTDTDGAGLPLAVIALLAGAVLLIGVSVLAVRG